METPNGFLFGIFSGLIEFLRVLNIVEGFKAFGSWLADRNKLRPESTPQERENRKITILRYKRNAVDIYILFKWMAVGIFFYFNLSGTFPKCIVWYLIGSNLFVFFYHLVWKDKSAVPFSRKSIERRFLQLLQALLFNVTAFAYLFYRPYLTEFTWVRRPSCLIAYWYSISNSAAGNYDSVKPFTDLGEDVSMIQFGISFIFFAIIVGKAIPEAFNTSGTKGEKGDRGDKGDKGDKGEDAVSNSL